jgi:ParB/RepB/Spo0J family partition protein
MAVALKNPEPHFADSVLELPLACLIPAEDNPRRQLGDLDELATSIKSVGLIEPIVATPRDLAAGTYTVVAGHRRLAAAAQAGLDYLPVYVKELDDQERLAAMLVENLQRSDLQPLEEAAAFRRLIDEFGMSQRDLSTKVGRSQGHISKRLALLDLPKNVLTALDSGGITLDDARALTKLKDMPKRLAAAFATGARWHGQYERAVEDQLREHELTEKIGAATQTLKQSGVKIVAYKKSDHYYGELAGGAKALDDWSIRDLKLTVANHKNQPCHAAAVRPRDGAIVYVCTKPASHKGKKLETPPDEKEKARKEREAEKRAQLRAREKNIELGHLLEQKLAAPAIDERNMRLIADLLMIHTAAELAQRGLRYVDEASQTVVTKKDGTISRIVHVDGDDATNRLRIKLDQATTPEEIMGVLLQALVAAQHADTKAVPPSQRFGYVRGIGGGYSPGSQRIVKPLTTIANAAGVARATRKKAAS